MPGKYSFESVTARPADREIVGAILAASYEAEFTKRYDRDVLNVALPLMTKAHAGLLESGHYFLARAPDGPAVACGGWSHEEPGTGKRVEGLAHIRHFATHPDWVGRGAGRVILSRCLREAMAAGCRKLMCFAALGSEPFYAALGFSRVNAIQIPLPGAIKFPAILMQWSADKHIAADYKV